MSFREGNSRGNSTYPYGNKGRGGLGLNSPLSLLQMHSMPSPGYPTLKSRYDYQSYDRSYRDYDNYNDYILGQHDSYEDNTMSPWESGRTPAKNMSKRTLLPTPLPQARLSKDLMSSVNQLFQMGGTEKQLLNLVQAVVETQEAVQNRNYAYESQGGFYPKRRGGAMQDRGYHHSSFNKPKFNNSDQFYYPNDEYSANLGYYNPSNRQRNQEKKAKSATVLTKKSSSSKLLPKKSAESDKKEFENFPKEALNCHMCNISTFTSKESFLTHLNGKSHGLVAQVYHSKNSAILQMLRANSKIANMKLMAQARRGGSTSANPKNKPVKTKTPAVKAGLKGRQKLSRSQSWTASDTGRVVTCYQCMFDVSIPMKVHSKTIEHKYVQYFLNVKCCGKWYGQHNNGGRKEIEEHKLTLTHLLSEYNRRDKSETIANGVNSEGEPEEDSSFAVTYLEQLQKTEAENGHTKLAKLPPYDSSTMSGLFCIKNNIFRYCQACDKQFSTKKNSMEFHCGSPEHYENVVKYLKKEHEITMKKKADAAEETKADVDEAKVEDVKQKEDQEENFDEAAEDLDSDDNSSQDSSEHPVEDDANEEVDIENIKESNNLEQEEQGTKSPELLLEKMTTMPVSWSDASELEFNNKHVSEE